MNNSKQTYSIAVPLISFSYSLSCTSQWC